MTNLLDLPNETIAHVLRFCDTVTYFYSSLVCHSLNQIIYNKVLTAKERFKLDNQGNTNKYAIRNNATRITASNICNTSRVKISYHVFVHGYVQKRDLCNNPLIKTWPRFTKDYLKYLPFNTVKARMPEVFKGNMMGNDINSIRLMLIYRSLNEIKQIPKLHLLPKSILAHSLKNKDIAVPMYIKEKIGPNFPLSYREVTKPRIFDNIIALDLLDKTHSFEYYLDRIDNKIYLNCLYEYFKSNYSKHVHPLRDFVVNIDYINRSIFINIKTSYWLMKKGFKINRNHVIKVNLKSVIADKINLHVLIVKYLKLACDKNIISPEDLPTIIKTYNQRMCNSLDTKKIGRDVR